MAKKRHHSSEGRHHSSHSGRHSGAGYGAMHHGTEHHMEEKDAAMIHNDNSAFANLPTSVMMKPYPPCPAYMDHELEDNLHGIDKQQSADNAARSRGMSPHKY